MHQRLWIYVSVDFLQLLFFFCDEVEVGRSDG